MKLLRLFKNEDAAKTPSIGEIWEGKPRDDPWGGKGRWQVEVLDIRNGWVRYRFLDTDLFQDERMEIDTFIYCYESK